jgi:hypothetical protein
MKVWLVPSIVAVAWVGCVHPAATLKPAADLRASQSVRIIEAVTSLGRDGDWLVVRGYKATDDLIAGVVNAPISHVGVLDLGRREVIEADSSGVHATPLAAFVDHSHRLILVRPIWSDEGREAALARARGLVGKAYDFSGLVGLDAPERYYCSELAMRVYADFQREQHDIPRVIEPGFLYLWGSILFDSRPRHWETPGADR